jgi:hypothetical protein
MGDVDYVYGAYINGLFSQKGLYSISGDVVSAGLTSATAISLVNRTKTILAALATGTGAVSSSIDKNFFAQQTFAALAIAMQARREQARATINCKLTYSVLDYPLSEARRDLISYFFSGSIPGAFQEIQEEAAKAADNVTNPTAGTSPKNPAPESPAAQAPPGNTQPAGSQAPAQPPVQKPAAHLH